MTIKAACRFVAETHRHHSPPQGGLFAARVEDEEGKIRAVAIASLPRARMLDDGRTIEICRVASDGAPNACSRLYGALCRAAAALGYTKAITYTMESENGASVKAANFTLVARSDGGSWHRVGRPRGKGDQEGPKVRWERLLA